MANLKMDSNEQYFKKKQAWIAEMEKFFQLLKVRESELAACQDQLMSSEETDAVLSAQVLDLTERLKNTKQKALKRKKEDQENIISLGEKLNLVETELKQLQKMKEDKDAGMRSLLAQIFAKTSPSSHT